MLKNSDFELLFDFFSRAFAHGFEIYKNMVKFHPKKESKSGQKWSKNVFFVIFFGNLDFRTSRGTGIRCRSIKNMIFLRTFIDSIKGCFFDIYT